MYGERFDMFNEDARNLKSKYPELVLPVVEKPVGKFNQYMAENHMLIEVGSNGTSSEEAKASAKYIAEILDEYFKQNR